MITHLHEVKTVEVNTRYSSFKVEVSDKEENQVGLFFNDLEEIEQFAQDILNQINEIKGTK